MSLPAISGDERKWSAGSFPFCLENSRRSLTPPSAIRALEEVGTYNANNAIVEANQANVKQLEGLQSFEKIYARFDGVITARNTDIGDLINSGSNGNVKTSLFRMVQPDVLHV